MADGDVYKSVDEMRETFRRYFVGLVFTILALAIQTAPNSAPVLSRIAELASWLLLMFAGVLMLMYLEVAPEAKRMLQEWRETTSEQPKAEVELARKNSAVAEAQFNRSIAIRVCFVAGLITLAIARGYPLVQEIAGVAKPAESTLILTTPN